MKKITNDEISVIVEQIEEIEEHISNILDVITWIISKKEEEE